MPKAKVDSIDVKIGKRLKSRRVILEITQQDLAGLLQISFQQVQKYEKGANRLSPKRLLEMSQALNVPINYFFQDIDVYQNMVAEKQTYYGLAEESVKNSQFVQHEEINKLIDHYISIPQPEIRQQILKLVITLSETHKKIDERDSSLAPSLP